MSFRPLRGLSIPQLEMPAGTQLNYILSVPFGDSLFLNSHEPIRVNCKFKVSVPFGDSLFLNKTELSALEELLFVSVPFGGSLFLNKYILFY